MAYLNSWRAEQEKLAEVRELTIDQIVSKFLELENSLEEATTKLAEQTERAEAAEQTVAEMEGQA